MDKNKEELDRYILNRASNEPTDAIKGHLSTSFVIFIFFKTD